MEILKDNKNGKMWLSQQNFSEDIDELQYEHCKTSKYPF